jgi:hypothetical protein
VPGVVRPSVAAAWVTTSCRPLRGLALSPPPGCPLGQILFAALRVHQPILDTFACKLGTRRYRDWTYNRTYADGNTAQCSEGTALRGASELGPGARFASGPVRPDNDQVVYERDGREGYAMDAETYPAQIKGRVMPQSMTVTAVLVKCPAISSQRLCNANSAKPETGLEPVIPCLQALAAGVVECRVVRSPALFREIRL